MQIDMNHQGIVNKYFFVREFEDNIYISGEYTILDETLLHIHVIDCAVCGAIVKLEKVISHSVWHESLVYKND
jgi:hypothetical protein